MPASIVEHAPSNAVDACQTKNDTEFRNYEKAQERVREFYKVHHENQTHDFVVKKKKEYSTLDHGNWTIWEAIDKLNTFVDQSDPDVDFENREHLFQTAERIRRDYPEDDWFHLVGLLHDLGKVAFLWGEPQWASVGDTMVVGCRFSDKCVYPEFFKGNADHSHPVYSTINGIYEEGCGLDALHLSWGHDEYLFQVLDRSQSCKLPEIAKRVIRYHSFYPWHTGGDYKRFMNMKTSLDEETLKWVKLFQRYDLYSKGDARPDIPKLMQYYTALVEKYCPGVYQW
mmetsp:Transcript_14178/g.23469  ORF Transcript_14178/g.23469 Transcript_14178/m.23469 type:complete len:284 (-) Transcript_14178:263-1114(-)|eukprot:CAMPEP_0184655918 /NCGR_PEP_ID=MMETSP0308-20130426/14928_1 /TAXON_ID=38269 /ORGANISM="Gloeochaete witrockiana, Strain SAG 46.84" /LENGTH=283 /DNA_ID=CAMNT_0027092739 /DNA_START=130 /DNA_END=981 /DNA_ORIENTATION=+